MRSRQVALLLLCMTVAVLNFWYVLAFMPTGHDDVGQRLTDFVARHYLTQDQRPFVWAFDLLLDRLPFPGGIVPESFLRMTFLASVLWMVWATYACFHNLLGTPRQELAALLTVFFVTFPSLEEMSRFSANAIPYFFSIGMTFAAFLVLRVGRSWLLGLVLLGLGISGHQMNAVLFLGLLLLAAFIDRFAYGSISLRHYAIRGLLPLGFAFAGYQVLLRQLSHVIYGTAPSVASWRSPREITEIKSFLLNFGAFVREILSIGSLTPAAFLGFILLTSTVTSIALTNATTRNTGIRMTTAIAAAFGLYVLNFLPTLAYGIAIPPRALFAAAISFCLVFLVLDNEAMESVARQRNRILVSLIPMTFSLIFLGSNLLHSRSNAADFREQYEKMSAVVEAIDDLTDVEEVQEVILIARKFEPPFATGWIQPNVRYYFGERGYKFSVTFLDSDEDMSRFESQRGGSQAVIRKTGTIVYVEW